MRFGDGLLFREYCTQETSRRPCTAADAGRTCIYVHRSVPMLVLMGDRCAVVANASTSAAAELLEKVSKLEARMPPLPEARNQIIKAQSQLPRLLAMLPTNATATTVPKPLLPLPPPAPVPQTTAVVPWVETGDACVPNLHYDVIFSCHQTFDFKWAVLPKVPEETSFSYVHQPNRS